MQETSKQVAAESGTGVTFEIEALQILHLRAGPLALEPGQCVSLSGPSGSGKSLFLRALADLIPHEGNIRLAGKNSRDLPAPEWRQQVMLVPPEPAWWAPRVGQHFPDEQIPAGIDRLALPQGIAERSPEQLSSGEGQRLAFLRALARHPKVLLLDEPTANLDAENAERLEALLREWLATGGMAVLVSHDHAQRQRLCQHHWEIRDNQVVVA